MKDASIQNALARVMVIGVLLAAALMIWGLTIYLPVYGHRPEEDKIFSGEPSFLRDPVALTETIFSPGEVGQRRSILMAGVLLLLLNPLVRVVFAGAGFFMQRDFLYFGFSSLVLAILVASFFW